MSKRAQIEAVERLVRESVATVDALAPEALRALMPALSQARDELRADLKHWLDNAPNADERFTAYQRTQALRSIEASLGRVEQLEPAMSAALAVGRRAAGGLAVANLDTEIQRLSSIFGGGIPILPNLDAAAITAKGDRLLWKRHQISAARYAGGIGDDIKHQFAVGLAKGETFGQLTKRLAGNATFRNAVASSDPAAAAAMISDGMFHKWRHWGDRLVRTENMNTYNTQHDLAIVHVNNNRLDGEEEYLRKWDASADVVTCPRCKELHGTTATIDGTFKWGIKAPPLHPYCRCVVLAWLARWGGEKGEQKARDHEGNDVEPTKPKPAASTSLPPEGKPATLPPDAPTERKNPKRVAAAKKAAEASAERRREIHGAVATNLSQELQVAWSKEGHKFMQEEAGRIRGVKDRVNAASTLSQAFAEKYGSDQETVNSNEGDRFYKRQQIEAEHAHSWADEQTRKHHEAERLAAYEAGEIDEHGKATARGKAQLGEVDDWGMPVAPKAHKDDDEDPPF